MSRIGELLLEHGWVDQANLRRALSEQSLTGDKRLCSMLIARGLLDPDHAARALGEQHGVAAVLQRHLEHRDASLAELLPAALARSLCALPIGRTRSGDLIVCVRDPNADVEAAIKRALDQPVVIAVAPASQLEQLIEQSYEPDFGNEFDVDLSTGTQIEPPPSMPSMPDLGALSLVELDDVRVTKEPPGYMVPSRTTPPPFASVTPPFGATSPPPMQSGRSFTTSLPPSTRPPPPSSLPPSNKRPTTSSPFSSITPPFATATPPEPQPIGSLELDPDIDPPIDDVPPPPPPARPPTTPPPLSPALGTQPPRAPSKVLIPPIGEPLPREPIRTPTSPLPPIRLTIDDATAAIADAISRDTATDVAMRYAAQRWSSSLLLAVKEGAALGHRGHGANLSVDTIRAVAIPLTSPSIVTVAHDTKQLVTEPPPGVGAIHERLLRLLGSRKPIAAPIVVAKRIACVIAVGDPVGTGDSAADLDKLATALAEAYTRTLRDLK